MNINEAFPSRFLQASDLQGREVTCTIKKIEVEAFDDGDAKPTIYFEGKTKGLVLNKTNANAITDMYGPETDNWTGKQITMLPTQTEFKGRIVPCIRVKLGTPYQQRPEYQPPGPPAAEPARPTKEEVYQPPEPQQDYPDADFDVDSIRF